MTNLVPILKTDGTSKLVCMLGTSFRSGAPPPSNADEELKVDGNQMENTYSHAEMGASMNSGLDNARGFGGGMNGLGRIGGRRNMGI